MTKEMIYEEAAIKKLEDMLDEAHNFASEHGMPILFVMVKNKGMGVATHGSYSQIMGLISTAINRVAAATAQPTSGVAEQLYENMKIIEKNALANMLGDKPSSDFTV